MQKDLLDEGGGDIPEEKLFLFPICYIAEIVFLTHNYQSVFAECKNILGVNLRAKPAVFSREKLSFSLQLLFKPFLWAILN